MQKYRRALFTGAAVMLAACSTMPFFGCADEEDAITLRVANWEEYIDLGDWGEDELIDIYNPYAQSPEEDGIIGENSLVDDFVEWFLGPCFDPLNWNNKQ